VTTRNDNRQTAAGVGRVASAPMAANDLHRVLIAGGGVAGLEALLALRDIAGDRVHVTVLTPEREFVYRPMSVAEPFARGRAERRALDRIVSEAGGTLATGALAEVDPPAHTATTAEGDRFDYDGLLLAIGARSAPVYDGIQTWTPERDPEVFGGVLRDLDEGYTKRVAFVVPPGATWPLPAYELALMTAWQAWAMNQTDVEVTVYTPEDAPMSIFGTQATAALRGDLEEAKVKVETGVFVQQDGRRLVLQPGDRPLNAQRTVALPVACPYAIGGVPADTRGFVPVDLHGRVLGIDDVWAAGDVTNFPIKQGGLAAQQADAAAQAIAARAGAAVEPQPFRPVLRGVVLSGRGRRWIRRELDGGDDAGPAPDEGEAERHALWWPPTKVAGRYLSPYLARLEGGDAAEADLPPGQPVELDVEREVPAAADALQTARRVDAGSA
jgi:sulfide:quinone oxidoreductase